MRSLAACNRSQATWPPVRSASLDWMLILEIANEQLLTPALWSALHNSSGAALLPADAREYLAALHRLNGKRNDTLRIQALQLIGGLNEAGITPVLLKGGLALFDGPYADPAARMMRDLDVLVPAGSLEKAIAALEQLGYRLIRRYEAGHHAVGDFARSGDPGSVDLHTELIDQRYVLPASEVQARAMLKEVRGVRYLSPCATDRVMHNLLHAQIHFLGNFYRGELQLQQVYRARRARPLLWPRLSIGASYNSECAITGWRRHWNPISWLPIACLAWNGPSPLRRAWPPDCTTGDVSFWWRHEH